MHLLAEGYTISQLRSAANEHEKSFYRDRMSHGKSGVRLTEVNWTNSYEKPKRNPTYVPDSISLVFRVTPTYKNSVSVFSPSGHKDVDDHYVFVIQFRGVADYVESRGAFLQLPVKEQKELMHQLLRSAEVYLWASDPSWLMQGHFENAVELGYSIYGWPRGIPRADGRWAKIKTGKAETPYYSLSKHAMEILSKVHLVVDKAVLMLNQVYRREIQSLTAKAKQATEKPKDVEDDEDEDAEESPAPTPTAQKKDQGDDRPDDGEKDEPEEPRQTRRARRDAEAEKGADADADEQRRGRRGRRHRNET